MGASIPGSYDGGGQREQPDTSHGPGGPGRVGRVRPPAYDVPLSPTPGKGASQAFGTGDRAGRETAPRTTL
ncbi:hypothetical protein GCM10010299_51670 [Streptomyces tanashiensis]|nr:hypothetical protein GCM10010299_51670 [Streptomyces tanashiensis]